nr:MAG TPA: portal protein [Caudoviricetes sp.]
MSKTTRTPAKRTRAQGKRARDAPRDSARLLWPQTYSRAQMEMATSDVITGAINRISKAFALMPIVLMHGWERVVDDPRAQLVGVRANARQSAYAFKLAMEIGRNTLGRAYAVKRYDDAFRLAAIEPVDASRVTPLIDDVTREVWYAIQRDDGEVEYLPRFFVMPLLFSSTDGITSVDPVSLLRGSIQYNEEVKAFSLENLKSINKAIVLEYPTTLAGERRQKSVEETLALYKQSGGKVLALESGVKLSNVTTSPFDAGTKTADQITRSRVAMVYGMPAALLGDSGAQSKATAEEQNLEFLTTTMLPRIEEWKQELDWWLLTPQERADGWRFDVEVDAYLKANAQARANLVQTRIRNGQLTPNEARADLGLAPKDGGDTLLVSKDLAPVNLVAKGATIDINTINGEHNSAAGKD